MFSWLDFLIVIVFLLITIIVGAYHGYKAKINPDARNYLTGNNKLPIFPVCLSLLTTFISGISLMAFPAEIYQHGALWALSYLISSFGFVFIGIFLIPIFYKLRFINAYQYYEARFDSFALRRLGTIIFICNTIVYMAVVIYAPSVAFSGITKIPLWTLILTIGIVTTVTAVGGIKSVIWTETLQAIFLYLGLVILLIKGTIEAGGLKNILRVNEESRRLSITRFNPTPFQYQSFWIAQIAGITYGIRTYGLNQMAIQRYSSLPTIKHAQIMIALTFPAAIIIGIMICYIGFLMAAFFDGCDPLAMNEIKTPDQMTFLMASRVLEKMPGMQGVFLASIFSATLSTTSSGLNSMTAVLWEDFIKTRQNNVLKRISEANQMRFLTLFFGILSTITAFSCHSLGGIFQIIFTVIGATSGPLVGVFLMGIFFPKANKYGAFMGLILGTIFMLLCSAMSIVEKPYKNYNLATQFSTITNHTSNGCLKYTNEELLNKTILKENYFENKDPELHYGNPDTWLLSRLSSYSYASVGITIVLLIGIPISFLFPQKMNKERENFTYSCTYEGIQDMKKNENINIIKN